VDEKTELIIGANSRIVTRIFGEGRKPPVMYPAF
jgi:hypothetical protein